MWNDAPNWELFIVCCDACIASALPATHDTLSCRTEYRLYVHSTCFKMLCEHHGYLIRVRFYCPNLDCYVWKGCKMWSFVVCLCPFSWYCLISHLHRWKVHIWCWLSSDVMESLAFLPSWKGTRSLVCHHVVVFNLFLCCSTFTCICFTIDYH